MNFVQVLQVLSMAEVAGNNKKDVYDLADEGGWLNAYCDLLEATYEDTDGVTRKLSRQQAAFVAWDCAPKQTRQPETMLELATLLNYKSEQVFYKWRKTGWYKTLILAVRQNILLPYLHDIDRKTIGAALAEGGSAGVQARKLFYEVAGVLSQTQQVELKNPSGEAFEVRQIDYRQLVKGVAPDGEDG